MQMMGMCYVLCLMYLIMIGFFSVEYIKNREGQGSIGIVAGKMHRFCIVREHRNRWRNCIYYDIIGVFDESETLKFHKSLLRCLFLKGRVRKFYKTYNEVHYILGGNAMSKPLTEQ